MCVHGLTGCARDFDALAATLAAARHRVLCVDVAGRGGSDWLSDPEGYQLRSYRADMEALLDHFGLETVDWVGTSMGGLVGMVMAASPDARLRRLVLNDIGPFVPTAALQRLGRMLGSDPRFEDLGAAEAFLRVSRAPFGPLTDAQWRDMAERSTRPAAEGYRLHYDPRIAVPFERTMGEDLDLWRVWDAVDCPVLLLRGETSDLLLRETAAEMTRRGPRATLIEFAGCGHNPPLLVPAQIDPVVEWLGTADVR